jgi:MtaA/CmuA family methyltransferase
MTPSMTSLQRYLGMLNGTPIDFVPRIPILMQFATEFIGSNYAAFAGDYHILTRANLQCARHFGIDQMNTMSDPYRETQGYGAEIIYEKNSVPHCKQHPLENSMDLDRLPRPKPLEAERMRDRIEAVRTYRDETRGEYSIMGWVEGPAAEAADLRTVENFFCDLLDEPEYSSELMTLCVDVALDFAREQIKVGAETIGVGDAVASQVSKDVYEELILPHEQRLVRGLKDMGAKVRMHICGNISHLLPGLATLELDVIDVDHMVPLGKVREALGAKVAIGANLDPVADVLRGTPEQVREKLAQCYREVGNPFIANAGCEIPSGTPEANLMALCEPLAWTRG